MHDSLKGDRHASNSDKTAVAIILAANSSLIAGTATAYSNNGDGRTSQADGDVDVLYHDAKRLEHGGGRCGIGRNNLLAALNGGSVALVTLNQSGGGSHKEG